MEDKATKSNGIAQVGKKQAMLQAKTAS